MKTPSSQRVGLAAALGAAVVLAAFAFITASRPTHPVAVGVAGGGPPGGVPLAGGQETGIGAVSAQVSFHVYLPDTAAASDSGVSHAWVRTTSDPEIYVEYQSGVILIEKQPVSNSAPSSIYQEQITEGVPGTIMTLNGQQVFIVPSDNSGDSGSVNMVLNGTNIAVIGDNSIPASTLTTVASSIINAAQAQT